MKATAGEATSYLWDFGGAATPGTSSESDPNVIMNTPGIYTGTVTGTNTAGSSTAQFQIFVRQPDAPEITAVVAGEAKVGLPLTVGALNSAGQGGIWSWDFGGACPPSSDDAPLIVPEHTGTFQCRVEVYNAAGSDGYDFELTVVEPTAPQLSSVWPETLTTGVDSTFFAGNAGDPAASWSWSFPAGLVATGSDSAFPIVTPLTAGTYECSVTATNLAGSSTREFSVTVEAMAPPPLDSVWPLAASSGQSSTFFASTTCQFQMTWTWEFGDAATPRSSTQQFPSVTLGAPGTYQCSVSATNAGGTTTLPFELVISGD